MSSILNLYFENQDTHYHHLAFSPSILEEITNEVFKRSIRRVITRLIFEEIWKSIHVVTLP